MLTYILHEWFHSYPKPTPILSDSLRSKHSRWGSPVLSLALTSLKGTQHTRPPSALFFALCLGERHLPSACPNQIVVSSPPCSFKRFYIPYIAPKCTSLFASAVTLAFHSPFPLFSVSFTWKSFWTLVPNWSNMQFPCVSLFKNNLIFHNATCIDFFFVVVVVDRILF